MENISLWKIIPNNAQWTTNHELRTLKPDLRFPYAIFSPESKTSPGKVQKLPVPAVTGIKVHQTFTFFSPKQKNSEHRAPFLRRFVFSTVCCMLSTVYFLKTAPKFHQIKYR
jgi:hypothetical protein